MAIIKLDFHGPYKVYGKKDILFDAKIANEQGIYLWTYPFKDGYLINYVGETSRSFKKRTIEHLKEQLGGQYTVLDVNQLKKRQYKTIWGGLYGRNNPKTIHDFIQKYIELAKKQIDDLSILHIFIAPIKTERRTRERIEGALANYIKKQPAPIHNIFDNDVIYRPKWSSEKKIITTYIKRSKKIYGLPKKINV